MIMKQHPAIIALDSLITNHAKAQGEVDELTTLAAQTKESLHAMELTADLGDESALAAIGTKQILAALLPRRLEARGDAVLQIEGQILTAVHDFITQTLGPKTRELRDAEKVRVRAELKTYFRAHALEEAVEKSAQVATLNGLQYRAVIQSPPSGGVVAYAQGIIATWNEVCAIKA